MRKPWVQSPVLKKKKVKKKKKGRIVMAMGMENWQHTENVINIIKIMGARFLPVREGSCKFKKGTNLKKSIE